jgi:predicted nucleic acid-binding protein
VVRFWDTSGLVPAMFEEATTSVVRSTLKSDPRVITWWGTELECASAIARSERERRIVGPEMTTAFAKLEALRASWVEIEPSAILREIALRLIRVHPLRAPDALQLAAATVASEHRPPSLQFVTLDDRLADAASREGFPVVRLFAR